MTVEFDDCLVEFDSSRICCFELLNTGSEIIDYIEECIVNWILREIGCEVTPTDRPFSAILVMDGECRWQLEQGGWGMEAERGLGNY